MFFLFELKKCLLMLHTVENSFLLNGRIARGPSFKKNWLAFSIFESCFIIAVKATSS